jgi:hypothetical protein
MIVAEQRICEGCGEPFTPRSRLQKTHDDTCRQRACRLRRAAGADSQFWRFEHHIWELRCRGQLNDVELFQLLLDPPAEVLARLTVAA